jgi:hypothetical protein
MDIVACILLREPSAQRRGSLTVAPQTKRAPIREVAFAAALGPRNNVVGIPKMAPHAPVLFELPPRAIIQLSFIFAQLFGIGAALRADPAIAREDLCAKIARVGT